MTQQDTLIPRALLPVLPLREQDRKAYLDWAVRSFRLVALEAKPTTQIHTHLCYSEFGQIIDAIAALDADVTSIEAARRAHPEIEVTVEVRHGRAADSLVEVAEGADLLLVGSRGRGGFRGMLLGSVTQRVLALATCPVAVLHRQ